MRAINLIWLALIAAFILTGRVPAQAQSQPTPQQLQSMIASGQAKTALGDLHQVLETHSDSGVAWYLVAEAQDSLGDESQARQALAKAEQFSPGLPFARQENVAALQAHLAQPAAQIGFHISPGLVIGALVILFLGLRFLSHRRAVPFGYQGGYAAGFPGRPYGPMPYGPGGAGYGPGMGGGLGSSLIGGLAAGAGFAAGERIIDGMISPGGNQGFGGQSNDPGQVPDRDDGLSGSPGWDDGGNNGGGFDSGGGW